MSTSDSESVQYMSSLSGIKRVDISVKNFKGEMENALVNESIKSSQFNYNDTLWHIEVFPRWSYKGENENVGVFLFNDNEEAFEVDMQMIVKNNTGKFNKQIKGKQSLGFLNLLTHQKCASSLVDGNLEIQVKFKVLDSKTKVEKKKIVVTEKVPLDVNLPLQIHDTKLFTDFYLVCGTGKKIPCHKAFLGANSPVLRRMLESDYKEAIEGKMVIEGYEEVVVAGFVKFLYSGEVDCKLLEKHAVSFMDLGEKYELPGLKNLAEQTMIATLSVENVLEYLAAGITFKRDDIKNASKSLFKVNKCSLNTKEIMERIKENENLMEELCFN